MLKYVVCTSSGATPSWVTACITLSAVSLLAATVRPTSVPRVCTPRVTTTVSGGITTEPSPVTAIVRSVCPSPSAEQAPRARAIGKRVNALQRRFNIAWSPSLDARFPEEAEYTRASSTPSRQEDRRRRKRESSSRVGRTPAQAGIAHPLGGLAPWARLKGRIRPSEALAIGRPRDFAVDTGTTSLENVIPAKAGGTRSEAGRESRTNKVLGPRLPSGILLRMRNAMRSASRGGGGVFG